MKHQTTQSTWRSFNLDFLTGDLHTSGQTDFNHPSLKNTRTREKATRCRTGHVDLLSLGLMLATVSSPSEHKTYEVPETDPEHLWPNDVLPLEWWGQGRFLQSTTSVRRSEWLVQGV